MPGWFRSNSAPTDAASLTVPDAKKEADFKSMVETTLPQDIETASFYELVAWCRLLGLNEAGDKAALVQTLKDYFKAKSPTEQKEVLKRIEIKSARSSEYFSLDDVKENYVLIQGNVIIVLIDKKDNSEHTIQAERVLYNQTTSTISASGNVVYKRKIGDKEEAFSGETFVFDVGNWEGVLYYGAGERTQKVDELSVMFRYSGETITRLKDNSIMLEKGVITSSADPKNPNYKIRADRIWVYSSGEWAVENASLFLGNIPVLFLPFFYYTSDELFFNPVFGFKVREGAFWQNTIYLIGKKKREAGVLDFMQLEQSGDQNSEMQLEGLYLRPKRAPSEGTAPATTTTPADAAKKAVAVQQLKLFLDLYSRLGVFAGVSLDATPLFTLKAGLGITRSIFNPSSSVYSAFFSGNDYWNSGYFFSLKSPLRFGLEAQFNTTWGLIQRIQGNVSYFSDPFFAVDFYEREENQDWGKIIGFQIPAATTTAATAASNTQRTTLTWSLDLAFNFAPLVNSPLFQSLRIDPFKFSFEWWSKTVSNIADPIVAADPARMFYYPQRIIFPNFSAVVGGTIYEYTLSNQVVTTPAAGTTATVVPPTSAGLPDLIPPFDDAGGSPADGQPLPDPFGLRRPDLKQDTPVNRTMKYFTFRLYYNLNHQFTAEHLFSSDAWNRVEDISYFTKNTSAYHTGSSSLNYELGIWEQLRIIGSFMLTEKYKVTYTPFQGFAQTESDKSATGLDLVKSLQVIYNPLKPLPDFQNSEVSYNLKWDFYNIIYKVAPLYNFQESILQFNRASVSLQQVIANLVFQPEDKQNNLKFTANIPPTLGSYKGELNFFIWLFQTSAYAEYKQLPDDSWTFAPLKLTELVAVPDLLSFSTTFNHDLNLNSPIDWTASLSLFPYQYLKADHFLAVQDVKYNFTAASFDLYRATVDVWNIKAALLAERMLPLNPLGSPRSATMDFVWHTLTLSYGLTLPEIYGWKNRVAFSTTISASLKLDFQKLIDSNFTLHLELTLKIFRFMDLSFSFDVYNNNVYRYIPGFVDAVNSELVSQGIPVTITPVNPLVDLLQSFNFFNLEDRYNSFFKLRALSFNLTHYLDDWVLKVGFTGTFQFKSYTTGSQYEWTPALTFSLKWLGIPQLKKEFTGDATGLKL